MDSSSDSEPEHDYYVQRGDKWIKVKGATSPEHAFAHLENQKKGGRRLVSTTVHHQLHHDATPPVYIVMHPAPQVDTPIVPQRADIYRDSPPPRRCDPPPPRRRPPPPREDPFELGRQAFHQSLDSEPLRTSPAPGYYLAGFLLHGHGHHAPPGAPGAAAAPPTVIMPQQQPMQVALPAQGAGAGGVYLPGYSQGFNTNAQNFAPNLIQGVQPTYPVQVQGVLGATPGPVMVSPTSGNQGYPVGYDQGMGIPDEQQFIVYDGSGPAYAG